VYAITKVSSRIRVPLFTSPPPPGRTVGLSSALGFAQHWRHWLLMFLFFTWKQFAAKVEVWILSLLGKIA